MYPKPGFIYFLLAIMLHLAGFSQEKLVLNDSTKLEVSIWEISSETVKFKRLENIDGPIYTLNSSDINRIVYKDGSIKTFGVKSNSQEKSIVVYDQNVVLESKKLPKEKWDNWVRMNIDLGVSFYENFVAIPRKLDQNPYSKFSHEFYTRNAKSGKQNYSPLISFNFLFGNSGVLRHLVGLSYLYVKSDYDYSTGSFNHSDGSLSDSHESISAKYNLVNLNSGLDFKLGRNLNLCMINSIGFIAQRTIITNGYSYNKIATDTSTVNTGIPHYVYTYDSTFYVNSKSHNSQINALFSFQIKMNYDFKVKENVFGAYVLGNYALVNRLTYWSFGLSWYPFKKFRKGFVNSIGN